MADSSVSGELPPIATTTPSPNQLNSLTEDLSRTFPQLSDQLRHLRELSPISDGGADMTITQLVSILRQNPGLVISLSYRGCQ